MDRRISPFAPLLAALLATSGCQDYNFNPVGHCLIQPGTRRVTLSDVSTADVLFVVDDSGSMGGEQGNLATQFSQFVAVLNAANVERVANALQPIDFHLAITTTSMFRNPRLSIGSTCENDCTGTVGSKVCCLGNGTPQPPFCKVDGDCDQGSGYACRSSADCGAASAVGGRGCFSALCAPQPIPCGALGGECGNLQESYSTFTGCTAGYADNLFTSNDEYPMGRFTADPANASLATPEARGPVVHFNKGFYTPTTNGPAIADLSAAFQNSVGVGTCGSGQEQGIEAARAAIERARGLRGGQTAGYTSGEFLHANSKLVVVWVTDEDDCSSPPDPASGVVFWQTASGDACKDDSSLPPAQQRQYALSTYADYFTSLDRPFAAAMVASFLNGCNEQSCEPGLCCDTACTGSPLICTSAGLCGGQGVPSRYVELASQLKGRGAEVVLGSVCDPFGGSGGTLDRIAQIVKPPAGLELPTLPAAGDVTILRIARADGSTRRTCRGPAPVGKTAAEALAEGYDWWFTASRDQNTDAQKLPTAASKFVYIVNRVTNPGVSNYCDANAGETYSADYIGQLPAATATSPGGCLVEQDCVDALGGETDDWTCFAGMNAAVPPTCTVPVPAARGTCICGPRATNCPNG